MDWFGLDFEKQLLEVLRLHLPYLRSIAANILSSPADVDDAVQAALISAWEKRTTFRGESNLTGWVARIVISRSYDLLRQKARTERRIAGYEPPDASAGTADEEMLRQLDEIVAGLPEIYRDAIHIGVYSNRSIAEAAADLGCSANVLYQRIHKAKELIKTEFARYENH